MMIPKGRCVFCRKPEEDCTKMMIRHGSPCCPRCEHPWSED